MTKRILASYGALLGLAILLLPSPAMTQDSWPGNWKAVGHTVNGMVCRQKWACVDPKGGANGSGNLVLEPKEQFTEGVCLSSDAGPGCGKCGAEQPPTPCMVSAK